MSSPPAAATIAITRSCACCNQSERGATVDHAATMRKTYERINAGDVNGFGELVADEFTEHQGGPGFPATKDGTLDFFRAVLVAFPDWRMDVEDLIAGGDKGVARVRVTGTHKGEFMGVPPTATRVDMQLIDIMRFDDTGLVCEHWGVADMLSLMQQLGVVSGGSPA
jgi:predicted ester cyclase